jgi:hypothetical protein
VPISRANTSAGPPAGNGTMILTVRLGNLSGCFCALAAAAASRVNTSADSAFNARHESFIDERLPSFLVVSAGNHDHSGAQVQ